MSKFPTSRENLALNIAFELMGESRLNRTQEEYMAIAARMPPLKKLHAMINDRLTKMKQTGVVPYQICHFRPGDQSIRYEDFPDSLSLETVRLALTKVGMRDVAYRRKP